MKTNYDPKKYRELLIETMPRAIETEEENERIIGVIGRLMRKDENSLSPEEDRLFRMLVVLVEDFEEKAYPIGPSNPAVALRELMREHGLKQTDMVEIFGSHRLPSPQRQARHQQVPGKETLRPLSPSRRYFYLID